ncbi:MAG TPA: HAD-IA family hydrolase [Elusimicrobiota bacterium]|nr:HAD-IA family hydrolase [Elusimicrobiota bacterium]
MIKAVIFDFDNTLMDFMRMKRAAVEAAVDAMIDAGMPYSKADMIEKIYKVYTSEGIEDQQIFDKVLLKEFGKIDYKILASGIIGYRRAKDGTLALYPHVQLTLTALARMGIQMAVVSDAPRLPVWLRICGLGLQHYFDVVVTWDDSGFKKPHARPFQMALERLGVKAGEALMIGDWPERDMVGAKGVGLQTVFARYGDTTGAKHSGADFDVDDIAQLTDIIRRQNSAAP